MTEVSVSFAGNLTDDPQVRYTESGIPGPCSGWRCRVGASRRRRSSPCRVVYQAEHAANSLSKGSRWATATATRTTRSQ